MAEDALLDWFSAQAERVQRISATHPLTLDLVAGALVLAVSYFGLSTQHRLSVGPMLIGIGLCLPLLVRRRSPELAFAGVIVVGTVQWALDVPQLADVAILIALYYVAEQAGALSLVLALAVVEAGAIGATITWAVVDPLKIWVGLSGLAVAAAGGGVVIRQRRALLQSLRERASQAEAARDQQGRMAAAAERARIAREMHDIVSHNLTVMIALADGATYAMEASPEEALPAVERISATGRQALVEMRRLLGVLHDAPASGILEPQPSLARLDELITQVEAAGLTVSVAIEGDPGALSEGMQLTVFRVAQEALTNTLKHAVGATAASLRLRCGTDGDVKLEVSDDGHAVAVLAGVREAGSGRGLPGMRERAAAYDGRLEAGPAAEGGWRVRLSMG